MIIIETSNVVVRSSFLVRRSGLRDGRGASVTNDVAKNYIVPKYLHNMAWLECAYIEYICILYTYIIYLHKLY